MPSRQSVPRIRVDLPDNSPCTLSPSSTLNIKDILGQARLLPKLLAEDFVFDDADDALYFGDGRLQDFPSFPMGRQPPLFILNSHRARLPFPIRQDAFELGDFCRDEEDACSLLTAPTLPRMKLLIKEQLYVQKWVDTLMPDNPPKHIPWTCEKPATKKKWIAEGSIFPADMVKSISSSPEQREAIQERPCITDTDTSSPSALADQLPHSRELCVLSEASAPIHASTESHASTPHLRIMSADVDPGILRGDSKTSHTPRRIVKTSRTPPLPTLPPPGLQIETTSGTVDAPLAARRGKSLSGLKLKGGVIEHLEYPDIPTAFRGSSIVWSPRFDAFPVPSFTDHESMLMDLKSRCAALGSGVSAYIQEPLRPQTQLTGASLSIDEWAFTRGLAPFDNNFFGSIDSQVPKEIADTSVFLPDNSSTPVKGAGFTARFGFVTHPHSTPTLQSPVNRSNDPPRVPLPPRPSLVNPSTPPHVRGILKKVKSVRFEDIITKEPENLTSSVVPPPQVPSERSPPLPLSVSSERPCTPMSNTPKRSSDPPPVKELLQDKKSASGSRLPYKPAKAHEKLKPVHLRVGKAPETSNPTSVTTSVERPCRNVHVKENTNIAAPRSLAKQNGLSTTEIDVRRGIEGTTRSRLSTPLRNIFRFR